MQQESLPALPLKSWIFGSDRHLQDGAECGDANDAAGRNYSAAGMELIYCAINVMIEAKSRDSTECSWNVLYIFKVIKTRLSKPQV